MAMTADLVETTTRTLEEIEALFPDKVRPAKGTTLKSVPADTKFVIVALGLAPAVTTADYPALRAAIDAIAGINGVVPLLHGTTPPAKADKEIRLAVEIKFLSVDTTPTP